MKKIIVFIVTLVIVVTCSGCTEDDSNAPYQFPLSKWQTTDKKITMYIGSDGIGYGSIISDEISVDVYFDFYLEVKIFVHKMSDYGTEGTMDTIELFETSCDGKTIMAKVVETTYFEVGQKFVFELVEENVDESEIPYPAEPEVLPETPDYDFPYPENETTVETESKQQNVT